MGDAVTWSDETTVLCPRLAMVLNARCRDVGVSEPLLHLRDTRAIAERVYRSRRTQWVSTNFRSKFSAALNQL